MNSTRHFCTLFNTFYLSRGLALYQSLLEQKIDFRLYIFCFDDFTFQYFSEKKLTHVVPVALPDLEHHFPELLSVKPQRSIGEYCWTSTSFTIRYCLEKFQVPNCTYLDADMYFYDDPDKIISEKESSTIIITPHHYFPEYDQSGMSGIYCVQFMYFENTEKARLVLNWWGTACIKWCYSYCEDGKFGDQKYLDFWPYYFESVHINRHHGAGVAPWNSVRYNFYELGLKKYSLSLKHENEKTYPLVFFHFHGLTLFEEGAELADHTYELPDLVRTKIYADYIKTLRVIGAELKREFPDKNTQGLKTKYKQGLTSTFKKYGLSILQSLKDFSLAISGGFIRKEKRNRINL